MDKAQRKELMTRYRQTRPEAGVYRIVNERSNRVLLGSSPTNTPDATDAQLADDLEALEALWSERQDPTLLY